MINLLMSFIVKLLEVFVILLSIDHTLPQLKNGFFSPDHEIAAVFLKFFFRRGARPLYPQPKPLKIFLSSSLTKVQVAPLFADIFKLELINSRMY